MSAPPRKPGPARKPAPPPKAAPRKATAARKPAAPRKAVAKKAASRKAPPRKAAPARRPAAAKSARAGATAQRPRSPRAPVDRRILERRRHVRAEAARRRRRITLSLLTLTLVLAGAWAVSRSPLFAVGEVRVAGVPAEQASQVLRVAGVSTGGNVLDVDAPAVTARVERLPWVKDARVRRLPGAIEIRVVPRVAVAIVRLPRGAWMIDEEGWVMGGGAPEGLVSIEAPDAVMPPVGERIVDAGIRNALAVHASLPDPLRTLVDRYHAPTARGLRLHLAAPPSDVAEPAAETGAEPADEPPGIWVRFGLAERVEAKAGVIELLLAQAREQAAQAGTPVAEGELPPGIAELDVRAPDNPVLIPAGAEA